MKIKNFENNIPGWVNIAFENQEDYDDFHKLVEPQRHICHPDELSFDVPIFETFKNLLELL